MHAVTLTHTHTSKTRTRKRAIRAQEPELHVFLWGEVKMNERKRNTYSSHMEIIKRVGGDRRERYVDVFWIAELCENIKFTGCAADAVFRGVFA